MSMRDYYRTKAAEFHARARNEPIEITRSKYQSLATQYSHLAENADRNDRQTASTPNQARTKSK